MLASAAAIAVNFLMFFPLNVDLSSGAGLKSKPQGVFRSPDTFLRDCCLYATVHSMAVEKL
jgi:hypothetical protein